MWARFLPSAGTVWVFDDDVQWGGRWRAIGDVAGVPGEAGGRVAWIEGFEARGYSRAMRDAIFAELGRRGFTEIAWLEARGGRFHPVRRPIMADQANEGAAALYEHTVEFRSRKQGVEGDAGRLSTTTHTVHNLTYENLLGVQRATIGGTSDALFALGHARIGATS